jgi:hypothetical protein
MKLRDFAGTAVRSRPVRTGEKVEFSDIIFNEMVTPPSRYYAEDRLSFGELSWKTLRSLVSIWVKTLSIFIARIVAEGCLP